MAKWEAVLALKAGPLFMAEDGQSSTIQHLSSTHYMAHPLFPYPSFSVQQRFPSRYKLINSFGASYSYFETLCFLLVQISITQYLMYCLNHSIPRRITLYFNEYAQDEGKQG